MLPNKERLEQVNSLWLGPHTHLNWVWSSCRGSRCLAVALDRRPDGNIRLIVGRQEHTGIREYRLTYAVELWSNGAPTTVRHTIERLWNLWNGGDPCAGPSPQELVAMIPDSEWQWLES